MSKTEMTITFTGADHKELHEEILRYLMSVGVLKEGKGDGAAADGEGSSREVQQE
jgi:hypothetical protein